MLDFSRIKFLHYLSYNLELTLRVCALIGSHVFLNISSGIRLTGTTDRFLETRMSVVTANRLHWLVFLTKKNLGMEGVPKNILRPGSDTALREKSVVFLSFLAAESLALSLDGLWAYMGTGGVYPPRADFTPPPPPPRPTPPPLKKIGDAGAEKMHFFS